MPPQPDTADVARYPSVVERLIAGEVAALEECYRLHAPLLRAYLRRFVPDADVDDVVQVVFSEVWGARSKLDPQRRIEPWLFAIARRRAIDELRRQRRRVLDLGDLRELIGDDGDDLVERLAWAAEVRQALATIPYEQREAIVLAYFAQLTHVEIAKRLGVPLGTIKARIWRGLRRLAETLEAETT